MGVGCSPGEKHWVEGLGCPALLVVGNEIFPTNPPLPLSPGQMFNRVTTSMTYEAQVGVCGNSHCLEPRRQVHIQVWRQDIEETRSGICKNKVSGPVLGREIWDLSQVQPWIWWFRDAFVLYVTARKSRAWHRKVFNIYWLTDQIKHLSVACWYPPFSPVLSSKEVTLSTGGPWGWLPAVGVNLCFHEGTKEGGWETEPCWLISMMLSTHLNQHANELTLERVRHKLLIFHLPLLGICPGEKHMSTCM